MTDARLTRREVMWLGLALSTALVAPEATAAELQETPALKDDVASGKLPKIEMRVPEDPAVAELATIGTPGGELRMLMGGPKDTRMMVVYGYARLVGYTPSLALVPDILKAIEVEHNSVFTLHLRKGHKWSDGEPFTSEDFRYWFEDVAQNKYLSPSGLPISMLPQGEDPRFEVLSETIVRYSWTRPNPLFLPDLAGPSPLFIYRPSHYLKQFHQKYAEKDVLDTLVKQANQRNWAALHNKLDTMYRNDNPDLPSLEPWILKTKPPSDRFVFERNPYYYRIDKQGNQLPYIDRVILSIADSKIIPAKTGAGESDLQARYLRFDNYTFLKASEERNHYKVWLWRTGPGSQLALYPNLNANDEVWRSLVRDLRFRRALSLAVDRHEINQVIYFGLAIEGQNTLLPQSPLFEPRFRKAWASFDPHEANRLLDLIGLAKGGDGFRQLPDGRPLEIIVENSGESTEQSDVLELIRDSWRRVGIKLFAKPSQLTLFRRRVFSGETLMSIDKGIENGLATAAMPPWEFAPTTQQQLEWPKWGQYYETKGAAGEPPSLPSAIQLKDLYGEWLAAVSDEEHTRVWHDMLQIWAEEVFSIGTVAGVLQPIVVSAKLRNIPEEGIYNWDPGAYFGIYKPDGFWFDLSEASAKSASAASPPSHAMPR
ncbi:MAG: ABC transporter substrate-binding protein [Alphaproteobacteria bacterium]|nr:ABC transporter substrate-binding protein [Alphaproteobacteria bacterium]